MPVVASRTNLLLRAPWTGRPLRTGFYAKSALPGVVVIRNDTATHRRLSGKSWRLVSTSCRPERAKEDTAGEAQLTNLCRRVRFGALPARCSSFAVSVLIFVTRLFRGCFVLSSLTPAVQFSSIWRVRFRSRCLDSWNRPHARAENVLACGAANAYSCRAATHFTAPSRAGRPSGPVSGSLRWRLVVVTRCPHAASAANEDVWHEICLARETIRE